MMDIRLIAISRVLALCFVGLLGAGSTTPETSLARMSNYSPQGSYCKSPPNPPEDWKMMAKGQFASGVVIFEDKGELRLDVDPCSCKVQVFVQPYEKAVLGETVRCGGTIYRKSTVTKN